MTEQRMPEICDYEGADYQADFWDGKGRDYEDRAERIAIRRLLPPAGDRLLDVGAGFGRYTNLFGGYKQVVLLDYSRSGLETARSHYGDDGYLYVAANVYQMPFAPGGFDTAVMIRVLHHMQDPQAALSQVRAVLSGAGTFLLEYANKRNVKSIARWWLRRQDWDPFSRQPVEFVKLNFDFHPAYVRQGLLDSGFAPGRILTVSHFRIALIKRIVPVSLLVAADSLAQLTGNLWQLSPSVFVRCKPAGPAEPTPVGAFWRCPTCRSLDMTEQADRVICGSCGAEWGRKNGIYDFKEPVKPGRLMS